MDTLILSAAFEPMDQVTWQRAMTLWAAGRVEVVEEYEDRFVRTYTERHQMPAVVRFCSALRRRRRGVRFSRHSVFERDKGRCQYCGFAVPRDEATYDHVIPRSRGGRTTWTNVVIACIPCNQAKADQTPVEAGMRLLSKPIKPRYLPSSWLTAISWQKGMPSVWRPYLA